MSSHPTPDSNANAPLKDPVEPSMSSAQTIAAPARRRVSLTRLAVVLGVAAITSWFTVSAFASVIAPPPAPGPATFAAYVDATNTPTYSFGTPEGPAQADVVLSFIVADPQSACEPSWGGYYTLDEAAEHVQLDRRIEQLRTTGGDVRVSFGGQAGTELSSACSSVNDLVDAYAAVIERYDLTTIDLDVEGGALSDPVGGARRAQAVATVQQQLQEQGRDVAVWITLPVAPTGLTAEGVIAVDQMLEAGVDLAGVNGMTMNFGTGVDSKEPYSNVVLEAAKALHTQVRDAYARADLKLGEVPAWAKVGITVMIGQNDVPGEVFTLDDAVVVNQFAREYGVGLVSMWSLNRDATCVSPLPTVLSVVQNTCSGIDQKGQTFAELLALDLGAPPVREATPASESETPSAEASQVPVIADEGLVDDPATSPFPIWEPLGTYPGGTKIVWHRNVYEARFWTTGIAPDTPYANPYDSPWVLVGPVLPGDTPAPLPTLPEGTYPQWEADTAYQAGTRVQLGLVPYQAKWWTQGQEPGTAVQGGSPWMLVLPGN